MEKGEKFISGGIVTLVEKEYIVFKGGPKLWSLQKDEIIDLWILRKQKKKKTKEIVFKPAIEGKFEAKIDEKVVFRANKKSVFEAFLQTSKYKKALAGNPFVIILK